MAKFTSKIKSIKNLNISFYNDVTLSVKNSATLEQALNNLYNFVEVTTDKGLIINIKSC